MNSLRHGLRAATVVLPGENPQEFLRLCDDLETEWQPLTRTEQCYIEQMAVAQWKLRRIEVAEASVYSQPAAPAIQIPLLDRLWQAQGRMERSFARAQHELERIQASRSVQQQEPPALQVGQVIVPAAAFQAAQQSIESLSPILCTEVKSQICLESVSPSGSLP